jgi:hypothetical protein
MQGMNRNFFAAILLTVFLAACAKQKEDQPYNCGPVQQCNNIQCVAFLSTFSFTIVDEATGADLIFGSNPTLSPADIKLYTKSNSPYTQVPLTEDKVGQSMMSIFSRDTMALQIKNEPLKFIVVKQFCTPDCCSRAVVEILYEGRLLVADDRKRIRIKR